MDKIDEFLDRSVENIYPSRDHLESVLRSGKKLKIYNGIDPTGKLHIGHMVVLRKLRQFQNLGHEVIVLIGDFTAQIGDPTDKKATRKKLTRDEVEQNAKDYKKLVGKIIDIEHADMKFLHNEEWSNKLKPVDMLELASYFTVQQLIERDMFQERIKSGKEIYLHEFLYPIFQAYDSVTMDVDMEIGGNDQTFNMLAGRNLMKKMKNKEKFVLSTKLLTDPTGKKMGKTEGNIICLDDVPEEIFGKVMSFPDEMIKIGFELLTDKDLSEINPNPRDAKAELAQDIVKQLYSEDEAKKAAEHFDRVIKNKRVPDVIEEKQVNAKNIVDVLIEISFASSRSDARRLVEQGGVKVNGKVVDLKKEFEVGKEYIVQVGKLKFAKVKIK